MKKKFTLIELLAVVLIFGILASIGLSISKPSQVKSEVSKFIGLVQQARAYALENRCVTYVKVDMTSNKVQVFYKDQFTDAWQQPVNGTNKEISQGVALKMFHESDSDWTDLSSSQDAFGVMFDSTGRLYTDEDEFNEKGEAEGTATGLDLVGKSFAIYDENNTKNVFLVTVNLVGSYEIFSGRDEIPDSYSISGL